MDRRKKRTSTGQYMMYIDMMEQDPIFATGRVPRDIDPNYLQKKWKELSDKLNTCSNGPKLTSEEWRKRLNDWKNTTRCKYRRSVSGEKDVQLTSLESKALELFGKSPPNLSSSNEHLSITLKCERDDDDEGQHASESFHKELQAAVEEAIGGDDDDAMVEEGEEHESMNDPLDGNATVVENSNVVNNNQTYRTIVVENSTAYQDEEQNEEHLEFITTQQRPAVASSTRAGIATRVQTVVATSNAPVTKLINGDIPLKRLRSTAPEPVLYEVKKANTGQPHNTRPTITIHNTGAQITSHNIHHQQQPHQHPHQQQNYRTESPSAFNSHDAREIARQLKRLADVKTEKLKFEIARFKFNNPGFQYNDYLL